MPSQPPEHTRASVVASLRERRWEIESAIHARIRGDGAPIEAADPEYAEGLRAAVPAALDYCLDAMDEEEGHPAEVPRALIAQARVAAHNGITLETVLRRYFAGYTLLGDFLLDEVKAGGLREGVELKSLLRDLAAGFDRLVYAVSQEHGRASTSRSSSEAAGSAKQVERLLAGEPLEVHELDYDMEGFHVGLIASGPGAAEAIRDLSACLDRRLLLVEREEGAVWAWLGGRRPPDPAALRDHALECAPPKLCLAVGEPARGLVGWRLTHRQARAALSIARRNPGRPIRYVDVALLASSIGDELLAASLREIYLSPLRKVSDGGDVARHTLRAYFAADRNISSTAALLGVRRHTVASRLEAIEERIGRPLSTCAAEVEIALRLEELGLPAGAIPAS
jgi:PucR C-terminal helix-turn-helix domain/GGDEF-like domain